MAKREIKPFMVTRQGIDEYQFTKAQIKAYERLKKAAKSCMNSGLSLVARQTALEAYPAKMWLNQMTTAYDQGASKRIPVPALKGCNINDAGADDTEYILDKYIKD